MADKKTITIAIMDAPYESGRSTTALRLIDLAAKRGYNINIFAYEGAVLQPFAAQKPHPNAVHGRDQLRQRIALALHKMLVVSAVTLAVCLVLACWPRRRRRQARGEGLTVPAGPVGWGGSPPAASSVMPASVAPIVSNARRVSWSIAADCATGHDESLAATVLVAGFTYTIWP